MPEKNTSTPDSFEPVGSAHIDSAALWRRLAALGYDLFILVAISFGYGALATIIAASGGNQAHQDYRPMFDGTGFQLGWCLCLAGYYLWCWHRSGQTIGMKTWKIQLRELDGGTTMGVGWRACLIRCLVAPLAVLVAGLGYWFALLDPQRRSLHDRLSRTFVARVLDEQQAN